LQLIRQALKPPLDDHFFETYRNLIYLASPVFPAGFFEERLDSVRVDGAWREEQRLTGEWSDGAWRDGRRLDWVRTDGGRLEAEWWRPVRQARLEEALRFAGS
jgi:hypothetical protein